MEEQKEELLEVEHMEDVKSLIADISGYITKYPSLQEKNFGLFYQHGRLGFIDLDAFAKSTKVTTEENGEEKSLAELKNELDKEKK